MRKILILADGMFTKKAFENPFILDRFDRFKEYGVSVDIASETGDTFLDTITTYISKIEAEGPEWITPDAGVMGKIGDAEVVVTQFAGVNSKLLDAAKSLKLIGVLRSGVESVNVEAAKQRGISVCNCPGRVSEAVADFTVALMLVETRNILRVNAQLKAGEWPEFNPDPQNATMRNRVVGLVGYGVVARKVASRLLPFGVKIIAFDPFASRDAAQKDGVTLVSLDELLRQSDFISMHARLTPESYHMLGAREFAMMKPGAIFINTARSDLVDEAALIAALKNKTIRSAAIDVYSEEPLPLDHPLRGLDNVTLTPHKAGGTSDMLSNSVDIMLGELERYFQGGELRFKL